MAPTGFTPLRWPISTNRTLVLCVSGFDCLFPPQGFGEPGAVVSSLALPWQRRASWTSLKKGRRRDVSEARSTSMPGCGGTGGLATQRLWNSPALSLGLGILNLSKLVQERCLTFQDLTPCGFYSEPSCPIHLWKFLLPTGSRRPFHRKRVALQLGRIEVRANGPRKDQLAARLLEWLQSYEFTGRLNAGLFFELAFGCSQRVLLLHKLALRYRPGRIILLCPERAAGMNQQHFQTLVLFAV